MIYCRPSSGCLILPALRTCIYWPCHRAAGVMRRSHRTGGPLTGRSGDRAWDASLPLLPDLGSSAKAFTRIDVRLSDFPIFVLSMKSKLIAELRDLYYCSMTLPFAKDFPKDCMVHSNISTSMSYSFLKRQLEKHCGKKCYSSHIGAH